MIGRFLTWLHWRNRPKLVQPNWKQLLDDADRRYDAARQVLDDKQHEIDARRASKTEWLEMDEDDEAWISQSASSAQ